MEIVTRTSCRALLLTPTNDILLTQVHNADSNWTGWLAPGGGMDEGETEEQALRRELHEELGLKEFQSGPKVWTRFHEFQWLGKRIAQSEIYFLVRVARFEPSSTLNMDASEMTGFLGFRWWKLDDLLATNEIFAPRGLPRFAQDLIKNGPPSSPLDVGI